MFKDLNDLADKLQELELPSEQEDKLSDILYDMNEGISLLQYCYRRMLQLNEEVT